MSAELSLRPGDTEQTLSLYRKRRPQYAEGIFEAFFGRALDERLALQHAVNLAADEFWLNASLKDVSFVTVRNQSHKVAHIALRSCTIWRRTPTGPKVQRLVAQGICRQWVMQAMPSDWYSDVPHCARCVDELGRILKQASGHGAVTA